MKLRSITIEGVRSVYKETIELEPLTAFWGPNGSGKTAVVGSIIYALTGRFPGLVIPGKQAGSAEVLLKLAENPALGFMVRLDTDEGSVQRVLSEGKTSISVDWHNARSKGTDSAERMLDQMVGDVSSAVDMFDPEKSVWRMSPEKRSAWALGLCASASGWSPAQLIAAVGPATDDWDPTLHRDAGTCLELNIERTDSRLKAAQKVGREAAVITEGVNAEAEHAVRGRIVSLETEITGARDETERLGRLLSSVEAEQAAIDRNRRDRAALEPQIKEMRQKVAGLRPPLEPEPPEEALRLVDQLDMDIVAQELEIEQQSEAEQTAEAERAVLQHEMGTIERYKTLAREGGSCPFCGTTGNWKDTGTFDAKIGELTATAQSLAVAIDKGRGRRAQLKAQLGEMEQTRRQAALLVALYQEEKASYQERCRQFDEGFQTLVRSVQTLEAQLANVPADRPDLDRGALSTKLAAEQARLVQLMAAVNAERQKLGVAAHRQGQLSAQTRAAERVDELKRLLVRFKAVRGRLLDDAVTPLRSALESLDVICVNGWKWNLVREETNLQMCMERGNRSLPVEQLSVGERYLATIALLVAKSMVRREPWSGLFLDNFEAIFPESARMVVLTGLQGVLQMSQSPVDNVLVAGACDAPPVMDGVRSYVRGGR